jgi:hypothetical protein
VFATGRKEITGFNMLEQQPSMQTQQLLYCKSSFVSPLLDVAFGHCDLQTLPHQTYFCGDLSKKELIQIIHEAWRK